MGADAWGVADRFYRGARPVWTLEVSPFGSARSFCLDVYYAGYILLFPDLALLVASATSLPDVVFRESVSLYRACLASDVPKVYAPRASCAARADHSGAGRRLVGGAK